MTAGGGSFERQKRVLMAFEYLFVATFIKKSSKIKGNLVVSNSVFSY